jgi:hypothetical protein
MDGGGKIGARRVHVVTRQATLSDARSMVPLLRKEDAHEILAAGHVPRHLLFKLVRHSLVSRTTIFDGKIAGMWGCGGTLLSDTGEAWLFTTYEVERYPMAFLREAARAVEMMLGLKSVLISDVDARYNRSLRFMSLLGFDIGAPQKIADGEFCRITRRR